MRLSILTAILALAGNGALALDADGWRSQSIYFLLTDRFARTDGSTSAPCELSQRVVVLFCSFSSYRCQMLTEYRYTAVAPGKGL